MVIGGGRGYHGDTYFYDLNKEKWSKGPPLKKGRSGHAAGIVIDEITKAKIIHKFNTCLFFVFLWMPSFEGDWVSQVGFGKFKL